MKQTPPKIKVQVTVCAEAHPELYAAIQTVSVEGRAERIRTLGSAFLLSPQGSTPLQPLSPQHQDAAPAQNQSNAKILKAGASIRRIVDSE